MCREMARRRNLNRWSQPTWRRWPKQRSLGDFHEWNLNGGVSSTQERCWGLPTVEIGSIHYLSGNFQASSALRIGVMPKSIFMIVGELCLAGKIRQKPRRSLNAGLIYYGTGKW